MHDIDPKNIKQIIDVIGDESKNTDGITKGPILSIKLVKYIEQINGYLLNILIILSFWLYFIKI